MLKSLLGKFTIPAAVYALALMAACSSSPKESKITPIPFDQVELTDGFWKTRTQTILDQTIPFALDKCEPAIERFRRCAKFLAGEETELPQPHRYISSDMYKVMEGAAYSLMLRPDPKIEETMDYIIDLIGASQEEDGYIYITHTVGNPNHAELGDRRYGFVRQSHELYNMGHMYEAAVAYYQATGKRKLLDISEKNAQHINKVFFEGGDPKYNDGEPVNQAPGHQEIELALCKLYRVTGDRLYLNMAKKFLDIRGVTYKPGGKGTMSDTYAQEHLPVAEQTEAVGHSVRAVYLYTGMAQVDALTGDNTYDNALNSIWEDLTSRKMHVTGGLGAVHGIEGFGAPYELPNATAYNETCAAVANVFFNQAMFLNTGDAKYLDVAEVSLFNNSIAGINLAGDRFFYQNPLERDEAHKNKGRSEWFGTSCCPPNITRLILQVPGYMYAYGKDKIYLNLYGGSKTTVPLGSRNVALEQSSDYPFDGKVTVKVSPDKKKEFAVHMRIPTWARSQEFVPGGLYYFEKGKVRNLHLLVNGKQADYYMEDGFAVIDRLWEAGDVIELDLPVEVRYIECNPNVEANINRTAVTRGPLLYCAEEIDNGMPVQKFALVKRSEEKTQSTKAEKGILKGIETVKVPATVRGETSEISEIAMIPYYAWSNRGDGKSMIVWMENATE